ncbi:uncharacterized protein [Aegilops tauschii subsp. strangulata]|uniref:USP domain-containing protein n=4 Tax=Aegilops tauschii TaxID=37682 RepID=A0A453A363_AEGTS|nr:uncharacterized protein LOC109762585 [Aegilops tauschii subsp. strangulata]
MGIQDIRDGVASFFVMLNKETYILFRIEILVVLVTLLFFVMFIMDVFRRNIHNTKMATIFSILDAVSDSIVVYLLGAMQTAKFKNRLLNQLFPVWGLVLVSFRYNIDFISGYGVHDQHGRRFIEWRNVVKLLGSAFLNLSSDSRFAVPLWSLLALQILKSGYRFYVHSLTVKSVWHGKSSEVVTEHMRAGSHSSNWKPEECNPENMAGYKYLVYGETKQSIKFKKPQYAMYIDTARNVKKARRGRRPRPGRSTLITLDKIWGCYRHLLDQDSNEGNDQKDLSLAFALSRLLRCRLEDVTLQQKLFHINRKLVKNKILEEQNASRAFRIMELQLSFVNDYFNTRYPMVFWCGFLSLFSNLLLSTVTFGVVCWLAVDIHKVYKPPKNDRARVVHGVNVDMIITWVFMIFMLFKEIWEMVSYLVSNWTRLLLVCMYAQRKEERTRNRCMEGTISSFFKSRITSKLWHGHIDQYVFLESYDNKPRIWNFLHYITIGMSPKKDDGATLHSAIDVPECVTLAALEKLRMSLEKLSSPGIVRDQPDNPNRNQEETIIRGRSLSKAIISLSGADCDRRKGYRWACYDLPTCSHVILVWHIATSLCEMELAQRHDVDLSKHGFLNFILSYFTSCCSSKPYLLDVDNKTEEKKKVTGRLPDELHDMYITANSLSRYCAYLLVSKPDVIPDSFNVPKMVLQETVTRSRDDILKNCDSLKSRYDKLMEEAEKATKDVDDVMRKEDVVRLGAMLGKQLIGESQKDCWEILSGVWADLLVHIAPTWNAEVHKKCLESGGEFITYFWALLWHCGIEKSNLWLVEGLYDIVVVRGMWNGGNTCYFNAVLQSLLALDKLRARMLGHDALTGDLGEELQKLFRMTTNTSGAEGVLMPDKFFSYMCKMKSDFKLGVMEDSNNMLGSLLDGLNNEEHTMVESLFYSEVAKHVSSKECEHTSVTSGGEYLDLSLAIPPKRPASIEDCLDFYATGEIKDWHCMHCSAAAASRNASLNQEDTSDYDGQPEQSENKTYEKGESSHQTDKQTRTPNQNNGKLPMLDSNSNQMEESHREQKEEEKIYRAATVQYRITKAAPILTIQLKRFDYSHTDKADKLEEHVSFQDTLDMTKFMDPGQAEDVEYKYRLVAVIVHSGPKLHEGHNFAYVRASQIGGQQQESSGTPSWFCANDESITQVSLQQVLECQAYMLFYERVELPKAEPVVEEHLPTEH